jgi:protein ImuA
MNEPAPIHQLRSQLAKITGASRRALLPLVPTGVPSIDRVLPGSGLPRGGIHDLCGDMVAATGFLAALLGRQRAIQQVIWITPQPTLFAPALSQLRLDHRRLHIVWARRSDDRLWAMEEALKDMGQGAVVAEVETANLTETRRLQLAAESSGSIGFLLRRDQQTSASFTRWRVEPAPSQDCRPTWRVTLERQRGAEAGGSWVLEWDNAAVSFNLAPPVADRQVEAAE